MRTLEAASRERASSVAMLRAERDLDDEADARALLADPLTPPEIVEALRAADGPDRRCVTTRPAYSPTCAEPERWSPV